jgi:hypothetical protein
VQQLRQQHRLRLICLMTESCNGKYVLKPVQGEAVGAGRSEVETLLSRASTEIVDLSDPDPRLRHEEHGVHVATKTLGELIVDNPRINREQCEMYLSCGPVLSSLPSQHP